MTDQLIPIATYPYLYVSGLQISRTGNGTLSIAAGAARDSNDVLDIVLTAATTLSSAASGINGLDTGTVAASTLYYVYVISSSNNSAVPGTLLSTSATAPALPFGYDSIRLIGYFWTDGSSHFLTDRIVGNGSFRRHYFDTAIKVLTDGASQTLANIDVSTAVPPVDGIPVNLQVDYTPNTAGDYVSLTPFGSTATVLPHVAGSVATKINTGQVQIQAKLNTATPTILYINSAASGKANIWVTGFEYFI